MEVCFPCNTADHPGLRNSAGPSRRSRNQHSPSAFCMKDLKTCLTSLQNNDGYVSPTAGCNPSPGLDGELEETDDTDHHNQDAVNRFSRSVTFPQSSALKTSGLVAYCEKEKQEEFSEVPEQNGSTEDINHPSPRSLSLPVSLKLVSAMKGSRERQGIPPKKLSVTWASDVYDPIPTSVSHFPSSKQQRHRSYGKKSMKNKQKGVTKSSRSGKSKDKKWKNGARSYESKPFHGQIDLAVSGSGVPQANGKANGKELMLEARVCPAEMVF